MNYLTTSELSEIWKISARRISLLCRENRIEGAVKKGKTWLIPVDAKKPEDPRKVKKMVGDTLDYYNKKASEFAEGTVDVQFTKMQDTFLEYIPIGGKILDFGCGSGRDTKYFLSKGYDVEATDGSEELCKIASKYAGITVKKMLFEELNCIDKYDGVWACASILHVVRKELPDILQKVADATKTNGVVYTSFKYGDFEGTKNGRYFTYLTEDSFVSLLGTISKLTIEKIWVSADVRVERGEERWLNVILRKQAID